MNSCRPVGCLLGVLLVAAGHPRNLVSDAGRESGGAPFQHKEVIGIRLP